MSPRDAPRRWVPAYLTHIRDEFFDLFNREVPEYGDMAVAELRPIVQAIKEQPGLATSLSKAVPRGESSVTELPLDGFLARVAEKVHGEPPQELLRVLERGLAKYHVATTWMALRVLHSIQPSTFWALGIWAPLAGLPRPPLQSHARLVHSGVWEGQDAITSPIREVIATLAGLAQFDPVWQTQQEWVEAVLKVLRGVSKEELREYARQVSSSFDQVGFQKAPRRYEPRQRRDARERRGERPRPEDDSGRAFRWLIHYQCLERTWDQVAGAEQLARQTIAAQAKDLAKQLNLPLRKHLG